MKARGQQDEVAPEVPRFDERDTMFARAERSPETPEYDEYYQRNPDVRVVDDRIRKLPALLQTGGRYYDEVESKGAEQYFSAIDELTIEKDVLEKTVRQLTDSEDLSDALSAVTLELGAVASGTTSVRPEFVYSQKGRFDADYGRVIDASTRSWAVVFLVEMDHSAMSRAPRAPTIVESAHQYLRAARIAKTIEAALKRIGVEAQAQFDAHYEVILPALAVDAGLGEVGRNNILIADRFGSRVRIGAVTCDRELRQASPVDLGMRRFCEVCKKCSENCPTGSLSSLEPSFIRGHSKWPTRVEKCYAYWRRIGTDCGICMAVCPFSHRDNWFHNSVRWSIRTFPWIARMAVLGDDMVYGRRWKALRDE